MDRKIIKQICKIQKEEITGYCIYNKLASRTRDGHNAKILRTLASHEMNHYEILKKYTKTSVAPSKIRIFFYILFARILGLTFSLKLMENGERKADETYSGIGKHIAELEKILHDEDTHEKELLNMIDEEALNYMGSVVLGLNDALVELSGALAGFTFAIQNSRTIALIGLITGIAATFSMAASEFLSQRQEGNISVALKSSLYTGIAYVGTVILLVMPYFLIYNPFINLGIMMLIAILIIVIFNFYISVAKDLPFRRRFAEMALISISVAVISFGVGWLVRTFLGLEI